MEGVGRGDVLAGSRMREGGRGKLLVGSALIAVRGGGRGRGLVDVAGVVLVLGARCSS